MVTGNTAHIMMVIAAWSQMDDPDKSAVADKVEWVAPPSLPGMPTAPGLGHWLAGVSHNVPDDRKRAAIEFLRWFQTRKPSWKPPRPAASRCMQRSTRSRSPTSTATAVG